MITYVSSKSTKLSFKHINHNHTCLKLTSLPTIIERSFVYPQERKPPLLLTDTRGKSVDLVCGERNIGWRSVVSFSSH